MFLIYIFNDNTVSMHLVLFLYHLERQNFKTWQKLNKMIKNKLHLRSISSSEVLAPSALIMLAVSDFSFECAKDKNLICW